MSVVPSRLPLALVALSLASWLAPLPAIAGSPSHSTGEGCPTHSIGEACLTHSIARHRYDKASVAPETVEEIERLLAPRSLPPSRSGGPEWHSYISPTGRFEMHYTNEGLDRVAQKDVHPENGIPDLVEDCAVWADVSWAIEIDSLGYEAPPLPADGTYDITFMHFTNLYILGACGPVESEGPDHTEILLRRRFTGDPLPPESADELASGTIAHELKHAIQYLVNHWLEWSWIEMDANWVIDHVFDESSHGPTGEGSQLSNPEQSLDHGGRASYEDYLWEEYLWGTHGNAVLLDFWDIRKANPTQAVLDSFGDAQALYGAGWGTSYPEFMEWCWFSGSLARPGFGFEEADEFRDVELRELPVSIYPHVAADSVAHLACHHRRFEAGSAARTPRIVFDGDDTVPDFVVSVIAGRRDGTFTIVHPPLDASQNLDHLLPVPWGALSWVGVTVTNTATVGAEKLYSLQVLEEATTDVVVAHLPSPELRVQPNPFRASTVLRFAGTGGHATVTVHDVRGRVVRTLWSGRLEESERALPWDGRTGTGAVAPAGVYWVRLSTSEGSLSRTLTRVR